MTQACKGHGQAVSRAGCERLDCVPVSWSGGGPKGERNGNDKHRRFTAEAVHIRRSVSALVRASRRSLAALSN